MPKRKSKEVVNFLKDTNDIVRLVTGKSVPDLVGRAMNLLGITEKVNQVVAPPRTGPYAVLGVREDASDIVVKAAFRSLQKRFHPDTGLEPSEEKSKAINKAYGEIEELRRRKL